MAKQTVVNLEPLATHLSKVNSNFTELYDNVAFKNTANTYTGLQTITQNYLSINGTWLSDTAWWNWKASLDLVNASSWANYRTRVNASNNYVIDYFNWATWSNKLILWNDWSLTVNWQNRTSGWTSWTPTRTAGITCTLSVVSSWYKQIWKTVTMNAFVSVTATSTWSSISFSIPISADSGFYAISAWVWGSTTLTQWYTNWSSSLIEHSFVSWNTYWIIYSCTYQTT